MKLIQDKIDDPNPIKLNKNEIQINQILFILYYYSFITDK